MDDTPTRTRRTVDRARQLAKLPAGKKPPPPGKALLLARSKAYQDAADAPSTLRAYAADWKHFGAWCAAHGFVALPAAPETVGAYLAAAGPGYALPTLRRRVAAIARKHRQAKQPLDTRHPAIRETLRGIARLHGEPARKAAALGTEEVRQLVATCDESLAGLRDRALLLVAYAGAFRRSELVALDVAHLSPAPAGGIKLLIPRSKADKLGEGAEVVLARGSTAETCPVRSLHAWLKAAGITEGPLFRKVDRWGAPWPRRLSADAVRQILLRHAALAGIKGTLKEPVSPHGLRAGFVTTAYRAGVPDEAILGHTRHKDLRSMRGDVRRAKLGHASPSGRLGL